MCVLGGGGGRDVSFQAQEKKLETKTTVYFIIDCVRVRLRGAAREVRCQVGWGKKKKCLLKLKDKKEEGKQNKRIL